MTLSPPIIKIPRDVLQALDPFAQGVYQVLINEGRAQVIDQQAGDTS